jgi:hypothetical protein
VSNFGSALSPVLAYWLVDHYGNQVVASDSLRVMVSIAADQPQNCLSLHPYISGPTKFETATISSQGVASFPNLEVYCTPLGNLSLRIVVDLGQQFGIDTASTSEHSIFTLTRLRFRECVAGEYQKNGLCVECPENSYSLVANTLHCTDCSGTEGIVQCRGNQIVVANGYWRRYEESETILPCTFDKQSCAGGNTTGLSSCSAGKRFIVE